MIRKYNITYDDRGAVKEILEVPADQTLWSKKPTPAKRKSVQGAR